MEKVTLYSTHCPQCIMLENLLKKKKINFDLKFITPDELKEKGFSGAPILDVDGNCMIFKDAKDWVQKK